MSCEFLACYWSGNYCLLQPVWMPSGISMLALQLCCASPSWSWYHERKISTALCCCVFRAVFRDYLRTNTSWEAELRTLALRGLFCRLKPATSLSFCCAPTLLWAASTQQQVPSTFSTTTLASFERLCKKWRWNWALHFARGAFSHATELYLSVASKSLRDTAEGIDLNWNPSTAIPQYSCMLLTPTEMNLKLALLICRAKWMSVN